MGSVAVVQRLITHGLSWKSENPVENPAALNRVRPLDEALRHNNAPVVHHLLDLGESLDQPTAIWSFSGSPSYIYPLCRLIKNRDSEVERRQQLETLLTLLPRSKKLEMHQSALIAAVKIGELPLCEAILNAEIANPNPIVLKNEIKGYDIPLYIALKHAVGRPHWLEVAQLLVDRGANINFADLPDLKLLPLHIAIRQADRGPNPLYWLLDRGASIDPCPKSARCPYIAKWQEGRELRAVADSHRNAVMEGVGNNAALPVQNESRRLHRKT